MIYFFKKTLNLYIIFSKYGHEYEKIFVEEESIDILKILGSINNIEKNQKIQHHLRKSNNQEFRLTLLILVIQLKKTDYNTKIENKINHHDNVKYIPTQKFNKLTAHNFTARLKQANLASKNDFTNFVIKTTDFDNKLLNLLNDKLLNLSYFKFTLGNSLFGAVKLTKNAYPDKYRYSGYGIGFDIKRSIY